MSRIKTINYAGFALSATLLSVAVMTALFASGCGKPTPPLRPAPPTVVPGQGSQPPFANPTTTNIVPQTGVNDTSAFNAAQLSGLMGVYYGTFAIYDDDNNLVHEQYNVALSTVTSPSAPGKNFVQAVFQTGNQNGGPPVTVTSLMRIDQIAAVYGSSGPTYAFTSPVLYAPNLYSLGPILMQLQLTVNSATNQFDPAQSPTIHVVDGVFLQDVVGFYDDLQKH